MGLDSAPSVFPRKGACPERIAWALSERPVRTRIAAIARSRGLVVEAAGEVGTEVGAGAARDEQQAHGQQC